MSHDNRQGRQIDIRGTVQGVGFRPWICRLARSMGLDGTVRNASNGVRIEAFGPVAVLNELLERLQSEAPVAARVEEMVWRSIPLQAENGFRIVASEIDGLRRPSIPADLATCDECLAEIQHPRARRFRYPFTNCTACGPRFSIARDIPYDRAHTTMAEFVMCGACRREYQDEEDRRFHAQPIACPVCGPRLWLSTANGEEIPCDDPIVAAAERIALGKVIAIKGLGGFHLACDATSQEAVMRLRERKQRDHKPFAVMVTNLAMAERCVVISEEEATLLESPASPIVLLPRKEGTVAEGVAPESVRLGILLPYTPLHHLLLAATERPLVMTSGNLSDEPIAYVNEDALERLADIADAFLLHDRPIETRTDDSVVCPTAQGPVIWRRSRGYVPNPLPAPLRFRQPVLALGGQLKNSFCFGVGDSLFLGPHIGDLDDLPTYESYVEAIERMKRFLNVEPELLVHDLHPDYASTRYAESFTSLPRLAVQHHHAHLASLMAEAGLQGTVLGAVFDGTGLGSDGTAWGGEFLAADYCDFERLAALRPIALAGGDHAIREPWRVALALLDDAFAGEPPLDQLALFDDIDELKINAVRRMIATGLNALPASGAGRYFDAFAAMVLARPISRYEGELPTLLEQKAANADHPPFPFRLERGSIPWQIDLRPTIRAAVEAYLDRRPAAEIASRLHATFIEATAQTASELRKLRRNSDLLLSGGCFQNVILVEGVCAQLRGRIPVFTHQQVPPGDGGLAVGQAMVAAAHLHDTEVMDQCA